MSLPRPVAHAPRRNYYEGAGFGGGINSTGTTLQGMHQYHVAPIYSSVPKVLGQPGNETQATVVDTNNFGGGAPDQIEPLYRPPTFKRKL